MSTVFIGFLSQKGGVGKSALSRTTAREYANNGWEVKIADFNIKQGTSYSWNARRMQNEISPEIAVEQFARVAKAARAAEPYNLMVFDGSPDADMQTLELAKMCDLIVLPTGYSTDDMEPTIKLAHELKSKGIDRDRIAVAFCRVGDSDTEANEAADYIERSGYFKLKGSIPERTAFRRALDTGRALTETNYQSLTDRADEVIQSIINRVNSLNQ